MAVRSNLRVVIDARPLSQPHAGGFKTYVRALLTGLRERADADLAGESVICYIDRPLPADVLALFPKNVETRMLGSGRLASDFLLFARQIKQDAPDVVMGTSNYLPLALPRSIPQVVTIHDAMGVKSYPWDIGVRRTFRERVVNRYWAFVTRHSAHRARLVLTVSKGSRKELTAALGINVEAFRVVYNGLEQRSTAKKPRDRDGILVIESPDPRKNVVCLYRALPDICAGLQRQIPLRVVCNGASAERRFREAINQSRFNANEINVESLTDLTDSQLDDAYADAGVFVWPSRFEGFGLPPLEAMRNGCAVVSSSAPVMPEILGDVPLYADPNRPDEFAEATIRLLSDKSEASARGTRGRALAATYTCRRMADETVAVWREAAA